MNSVTLSLLTLNILADLSCWQQRKELLVEGIEKLAPDVIALQEVHLSEGFIQPNPAEWLAEQFNYTQLALCPKTGRAASFEGLALLSRLPILENFCLDLQSQQRVAQIAAFSWENQKLILANCHLFWQPGESPERLRQVERLLKHLDSIPGKPYLIVCGDFNGEPHTQAIQLIRQRFRSAHVEAHGVEPDYTCPTPLKRSTWSLLRTMLHYITVMRPSQMRLNWRGVLDYIFVDPRLRVIECRVVLDQPAKNDPRLYPSDHFGLFARLEIPLEQPI